MEIINVPFDQLKISKLNPHYHEPRPDVGHIKPSIREKGILQPLLIRPEDGIYGVIFGRDRWFSVKEILEEGGTFDALPCVQAKDGDDAAALEAALIENYARRERHPLTLCENFQHLIKMGRTIEGIAVTFAKTPAQVRGCLALAKLSAGIRKLYKTRTIDDDTAAALTLATPAKQKEWLALWEKEDAPTGRWIKKWALGGEQIATTAALFPLENYKGQTVGDLFSAAGENAETVNYFRDLDLFWELQQAKIAELAEALKADGWEEVHVLEVGHDFHPHSHVKTSKDKGGHVYITAADNGVVQIFKGWLTFKEVQAIEKAAEKAKKKSIPDDKADKGPPKPVLTSTLENYLDLHRHAVVCADLLDHPRVAFRLLVAHAFASSGNWRVKSEPQVSRSDAVADSIAKSPAQAALAAQKEAVEAMMGLGNRPTTEGAFARLLELPDPDVLRIGVVVMADTLAAGSKMVDAVGVHLGTDARRFWQPDDTFFELVRDRATLNALLAEIGGKTIAKANIAEKGKTQKGIIRDFLAGTNGRAKVEGWLPSWLEYPYRDLGAKVKKLKPKADAAPLAIAAE